MSYISRLHKAFEGAVRLPLNPCTKYVIFSDCHRGVGNANDNFLKNQTLYVAALQHYLRTGFTYIELGDGDELWENRSMEQIIEAHTPVFELLSHFYRQKRLYLLYGNHDIVKKDSRFLSKCYGKYPCSCGNHTHLANKQLLSGIQVHEGIILEATSSPGTKQTQITKQTQLGKQPHVTQIYLTHGHQANLFNSTLWPLSRFLVKFVWKPLERLGFSDPTSAAKNYSSKEKTEKRLHRFAEKEGIMLIAGHTHRPLLSETDLFYCNSGSSVHPYSITCLEIEDTHISLIKWALATGPDMRLYVSREVLSGPISFV